MFLFLLGGSLVLGAGLLATASFSDGTLVTTRTAAQLIGWLFVCAILLGWYGLRRARFGEISAATVTFLSGVAMLYVSYFEWGEIPAAPIRHAAAEVLSAREADYKLIDDAPPVVTLAAAQFITAVARRDAPAARPAEPQRPAKKVVAGVIPPRALEDACASFTGIESLQCRRCADTSGVSWIVCQERERLEYCDGRQADEASCPSAIPSSPPQ